MTVASILEAARETHGGALTVLKQPVGEVRSRRGHPRAPEAGHQGERRRRGSAGRVKGFSYKIPASRTLFSDVGNFT